jgi:hypothetical protein
MAETATPLVMAADPAAFVMWEAAGPSQVKALDSAPSPFRS